MADKLQILTPATTPPITLAEAKEHLNIDVTNLIWDEFVMTLILAAAEYTEERIRKTLITTTYIQYRDFFPAFEIELQKPPLQSVTTIKYLDSDGVEQTLPTAEFDVDIRSEPGKVQPKDNEIWPETDEVPNAVFIEYIAGFGKTPGEIPNILKSTIKLIVAHLFDNREFVQVMQTASEVPWPRAIERLLNQHSIREFV